MHTPASAGAERDAGGDRTQRWRNWAPDCPAKCTPLLLQVQVWEAGGSMAARVSDDEAYDAALALVGAGVLSRTPRQVRTARALLTQLDSRQDGCARVRLVVLANGTRHRVVRCCFAAMALRTRAGLVRPWVC